MIEFRTRHQDKHYIQKAVYKKKDNTLHLGKLLLNPEFD